MALGESGALTKLVGDSVPEDDSVPQDDSVGLSDMIDRRQGLKAVIHMRRLSGKCGIQRERVG